MDLKRAKPILFLMVLLAASLACETITRLGSTGSPPLIKDDFSDSHSGWGTGTDDSSSIEYVNHALLFKVFKDNYFAWTNRGKQNYSNIHIEVTAKNESTDAATTFGVICGQQGNDNSFYYFGVTGEGKYAIVRATAGQDDVLLTNGGQWTQSDLIPARPDGVRIGADCGAGALALYVNGKKIDSAQDAAYADGRMGLFVWSGGAPPAQVSYDDLVVTQLK